MSNHSFFRNIRIVSLVAAIVTIAGVLAGCQKDENSICDFENPYEYVGLYHNEGLAYVLTIWTTPFD